jgi:CRISPR-associated protein Csh1
MLHLVGEIGKCALTITKKGKLEQLIEIPSFKTPSQAKVACINFLKKQDRLVFERISVEDYDEKKLKNYLYRAHRSKKFDFSLSTKVSVVKREDPEEGLKKALNRLIYWFQRFRSTIESDQIKKMEKEWGILKQLEGELKDKKEEIFQEIKKLYKSLNNEEGRNLLLTIKIDGKYLSDFEIFRKIFLIESLKNLWFKHKVESRGIGICYLCGEKKEVWGFSSPFAFYTMDKRGFSPDLQRQLAWKRLPLCQECSLELMEGKKFLDKYLQKAFYGFKFYLMPASQFPETLKEILEEVKEFKEKKEYKEGLLCEEDYLVEIAVGKMDVFTLNFLFFEFKQGGYFDIVRYVTGVPPSWIKNLYETIQVVRNLPLFKEDYLKKVFGKKWIGDFSIVKWGKPTIGNLIVPFFPISKETGTFDKYFINIVSSVLEGKPIAKRVLIKAFLREIKSLYRKKQRYENLVLTSFMLFLFLLYAKLIKR